MKNSTIVIRVVGGLGNQMYQYAFIRALSLKMGCDFKIDKTSFEYYFRPYQLDIFDLKLNYYVPFYERLNIKYFRKFFYYIFRIYTHLFGYYKEKGITQNYLLECKGKRYFEGVFGNYRYFVDCRDVIKNDFKLKKKLSAKSENFLNENRDKHLVSVHIRRSDYLDAENSCFIKLSDSDFYERAIAYIREKVKDPLFCFFSDDVERVKSNFIGEDYVYIDFNKGDNSWQDMILMSKCSHNIIANSTFSFWGAYLNENPHKIVIGPKQIKYGGDSYNYPLGWISL